MIGLLRSEMTKTLTTRLWWGLLMGAVFFTALQAVITAATAGLDTGGGSTATPALDAPETLRSVYANAAFAGAFIFALIMGVTSMTGEYRYQTVTPTFLATPKRALVVTAKAIAQIFVGAGFGIVATVTALVGGGITILIRGFPLGLDSLDLWRAILLGILAVGLWALLGLGIGTLIRNQVAAILVAVTLSFIIEPLIGLLLVAVDLDSVARFLPSSASSAMTSPAASFVDLLPWWAGALVMLAYAVAFAGIGVLLSVRRDIT